MFRRLPGALAYLSFKGPALSVAIYTAGLLKDPAPVYCVKYPPANGAKKSGFPAKLALLKEKRIDVAEQMQKELKDRHPLVEFAPRAHVKRTAAQVRADITKTHAKSILKRKTAFTTDQKIVSTDKRWREFLKTAGIAIDVEPTTLILKDFASHVLATNQKSKRLTALGEGNKVTSTICKLKILATHTLPNMYPEANVRGLNNIVSETVKWVEAVHGQTGCREAGNDAYDEGLHAALRGGTNAAEAESLAEQERQSTLSMLRLSGARKSTTDAFTYKCICLLQDYFLAQPLHVNKALRADAYLAVLQGTGLRSFQILQSTTDMDEDNAMYHAMPPMGLHHVDVSTTALNNGQGRHIGGITCHATACFAVNRNKSGHDQEYDFKSSIGPDAPDAMRMSTYRFLRWQLKRGALAGCYTRKPEHVWQLVNSKEFVGISPEECGFAIGDWLALATARREKFWQMYDKVLQEEWPLFPYVDEAGRILQKNSISTTDLNGVLSTARTDLCMHSGRAGATSCRKYVADRLSIVGESIAAAKCLAHRDVSGVGKILHKHYVGDHCQWDIAGLILGDKQLVMTNEFSLGHTRMPQGLHCNNRLDIPKDNQVWHTHFTQDASRIKAKRDVGTSRLWPHIGPHGGVRQHTEGK